MTMLDLPHIGFVIAAYAIGAVVLAWLIGSILVDHRALRRALSAYGGKAAPKPDPDGASA